MRHLNRPLKRLLTAAMLAVAAIAIGAVFGAAGESQAASKAAPSENSPPTISGTAQVGKALTADHGSWSGTAPLHYSYQWQRCNTNGGSCAGISGATARIYDVVTQDEGNTLRVHVTVKNTDGSASDTSVPTAVVAAAPAAPAPTGCPSGSGGVNVSQLSPPARLSIDGFQSTPSVIGRHPGQVQVRVHISACGGRSVEGALVYVAAIPFNQFDVPPEMATGSDGWSQLTLSQLRGYPASAHQQLLAVFLRARKSGDPPLAGISTSRLVSFKVNLNQ